MEIRINDKCCILTPFTPKLDLRESERLLEEIKSNSDFEIGLDLNFVSDCTIDFLEKISRMNNISVFNISSDIFALFNLMNFDKKIQLFVSELDFKANKRQLLNRNFKLV